MEDEADKSPQTDETAGHEAWVTTLSGELRAASIVSAKPNQDTAKNQTISADVDMPFTTAHRAEVQERLNPLTRRKLRQQEREAYIKNHPIKHLGYRALYRVLKPFSK